MQRVGNLYNRLCSFENLLLAHKKALRGTKTKESLRFDFYREQELLHLQNQLKQHSYKPQAYRYFTIYEPKQREISVAAYRDRVVHHAVVNVLEPIYEQVFIYHSYATRKNKGTHKAIFQAQRYLRKYKWFIKCDIKKYFDSIDHAILLNEIAKKIKDKEFLQLITKIVSNAGNGKSLPIGNLTSQFFANVYLNAFDHKIKRQLKAPAYIRYMDDFVVFSHQKQKIKEVRSEVDIYLKQLNLQINPSSSFINQRCNGLSFLGVRIFPSLIRIRRENLKRSINKIKTNYWKVNKELLTNQEFLSSMNSMFAHLCNYSTLNLRKHFLNQQGYAL